MAGNEIEVCRFLLQNLGKIYLRHIGRVEQIAAPILGGDRYTPLQSIADIYQISTSHSEKKADIYLNGRGISIKQSGGSFAFNRLQRANLLDVFTSLELSQPEAIITKIDEAVHRFHQGLLSKRNQPWQKFFSEQDLKILMNFLMLRSSPNRGMSSHPAEFILEASKIIKHENDIVLYTFNEYFEKYKQNFEISIRRQWIGQMSDSEHRRSLSISRKSENKPWVFNDVAGQPIPHSKTGKRRRDDFPESHRKTVYFLMIEKTK